MITCSGNLVETPHIKTDIGRGGYVSTILSYPLTPTLGGLNITIPIVYVTSDLTQT